MYFNMKSLLLCCVVCTTCSVGAAVVMDGSAAIAAVDPSSLATATKPNFLMLFADDFGWGDLHSYGHPTQEKGRIDEMAEQGIRLTQWYSAESVCTPSRMGLMTGRLPTRMGMAHTVFSPSRSDALPHDDLTIAERLRPLGYVSGMAGDAHLFAV